MYTVIGAGLIGLATAALLQQRGHEVRVIDPDPASQASHFAAGMLAPTAEMQFEQDPLYPLMFRSAQEYPAFLELVDAPTTLIRSGTLVVAGDRADLSHLHDVLDLQQRYGAQAERLTASQARTLEPALTPGIAGAVSVPGDHQINPRALMAHLLEQVPVERRKADAVDLGPNTIVCAGLGAAEFFDLPLRPVHGDILRLHMPADPAGEPLLRRVVRGFVLDRPVYLVPRGDELVLGATSREDLQPDPLAGGVLDLLRDAARILPDIQLLGIKEVSAGARPGTPDDVPLFGRDPRTDALISTGYFRHGILLAALAARLGADQLSGVEPSPDDQALIQAMNPERFS
ncbi:glycine oxidase ThiO [Corynebacterium gerontici]|uniref:glycine oxidase n=1 Tax=Corynebacterium gerontici TaxID=2079234 RepID=A0A3G6J0D4_9CORY|nr:glycine oxidase ThiO [Corynebacterium gerontici]AZA10408.1 Glycine oxidase [Corynebacterium gerontici]